MSRPWSRPSSRNARPSSVSERMAPAPDGMLHDALFAVASSYLGPAVGGQVAAALRATPGVSAADGVLLCDLWVQAPSVARSQTLGNSGAPPFSARARASVPRRWQAQGRDALPGLRRGRRGGLDGNTFPKMPRVGRAGDGAGGLADGRTAGPSARHARRSEGQVQDWQAKPLPRRRGRCRWRDPSASGEPGREARRSAAHVEATRRSQVGGRPVQPPQRPTQRG